MAHLGRRELSSFCTRLILASNSGDGVSPFFIIWLRTLWAELIQPIVTSTNSVRREKRGRSMAEPNLSLRQLRRKQLSFTIANLAKLCIRACFHRVAISRQSSGPVGRFVIEGRPLSMIDPPANCHRHDGGHKQYVADRETRAKFHARQFTTSARKKPTTKLRRCERRVLPGGATAAGKSEFNYGNEQNKRSPLFADNGLQGGEASPYGNDDSYHQCKAIQASRR